MRLIGVALSLLLLTPAVGAADGERVALDFLNALKAADVERAKKLFDPRYRSLPREGLDALFRYESALDPNLAFLVGQPFEAGTAVITSNIRSEWYVLDGTRGHYLTVPLRFEGARAPFVLPSPIAFGRWMGFVDFMNFVKHPDRERPSERQGTLTLRLRPTVAPGLITPPPVRTVEIPGPPLPGDPSRRATATATIPSPGDWYRPRDPGAVVLPSGESLTPQQLEALLPRLRAITIRFTVMQRGWLAWWKVEDVGFANPVFFSHGEEIIAR